MTRSSASKAGLETDRTAGRALVLTPWTPEFRTVTLGLVALVSLGAFESLAVTTTMPAVVDALGGLHLYAMAFAAPMATGVIGMVVGGGWTDRRGPARPLVAGVVLFVLGLLVAGTAVGMELVVVGRAVQGLGSGLYVVALYVVVARLFPDSLQARVFAIFAAAWVVPSVVGPALAGLIAEHFGWRWVFLSVPLVALVALVALRTSLARVSSPIDDAAAGLPVDRRRVWLSIGAGTGALLLHWGGEEPTGIGAGAIVAGVAALAVTVPRLLPPDTFRVARGLPTVIVVRGLIGAAFFAAEVYLPPLYITQRELSQTGAGLALTAAAVLWSAGSSLRGRRDGHWDDRHVVRAGAIALLVGIGLAASAISMAVPVWVSLVGWGLAGFGMGLNYPTLSLLTLRLSAPSEQGTNTSALQMNESLAIAAVLALSGRVFAANLESRPTVAFLACFGIAALCALAAVAVGGRVLPVTATGPRAATSR